MARLLPFQITEPGVSGQAHDQVQVRLWIQSGNDKRQRRSERRGFA